MKAKKQKNETFTHLEKIFVLTGLALVIVGCIANLYSAYINMRFIHDPIDLLYYFRYIILLGGGFAAGYLFTKKSPQHNQLFVGVGYAVLAITLYWMLDLARTGLQSFSGIAPTPPLR
jgi:FtsH-binding integral membrane protein